MEGSADLALFPFFTDGAFGDLVPGALDAFGVLVPGDLEVFPGALVSDGDLVRFLSLRARISSSLAEVEDIKMEARMIADESFIVESMYFVLKQAVLICLF